MLLQLGNHLRENRSEPGSVHEDKLQIDQKSKCKKVNKYDYCPPLTKKGVFFYKLGYVSKNQLHRKK